MAIYPQFLTAYNNRETTQVTNETRKTCPHQTFRVSFFLNGPGADGFPNRLLKIPGSCDTLTYIFKKE